MAMPLGYGTWIGCEFYKYRPLGNYFFTAGDARYYFNILSIGLPNCYKAFLVAVLVYLYEHKELLDKISNASVLKKWLEPEEAANWIYFIAVTDSSMHGQDVIVDNGECSKHNWISLEDL